MEPILINQIPFPKSVLVIGNKKKSYWQLGDAMHRTRRVAYFHLPRTIININTDLLDSQG